LHLIYEKIPLFALSAAVVGVSYTSSEAMKIVTSFESVPFLLRVENAFISCIIYLQKMVLPLDLAVFYPFPKAIPIWQGIIAVLVVFGISALVLWARRRCPYLVVGWFWYLGTLAPVLGLVQQGLWPSHADRFAYFPLIGLFMILSWGGYHGAVRWRLSRSILGFTGASILLALLMITTAQTSLWRNTSLLFEHAIDVTKDNDLAHYILGIELQRKGKPLQAVAHLQEALRISPDNGEFHNRLGEALTKLGQLDRAIAHLSEALRRFPQSAHVHNNMGIALSDQGKHQEAIAHYLKAIEINPREEAFYYNLGNSQSAEGLYPEAVASYLKALQMRPDDEKARLNLGVALFHEGRLEEALKQFEEVLRRNPGSHQARHNRNAVQRKLSGSL
jgi:tetratricopeptide (TPR) repeat protein